MRVDLAAVSFLGSEGIRALVDADDSAARRGVDLAVVTASPIARRVLEIGRLEHLLLDG